MHQINDFMCLLRKNFMTDERAAVPAVPAGGRPGRSVHTTLARGGTARRWEAPMGKLGESSAAKWLCSFRTNLESSQAVQRLRTCSTAALDARYSSPRSTTPSESIRHTLCIYSASEPPSKRHHGRPAASVVSANPEVDGAHPQGLQFANAHKSRFPFQAHRLYPVLYLRLVCRRRSSSRSMGVM